MRSLFNFLYQFLFIDQDKQQISHTKFWSNIGYGVIAWAFVFVVWQGETKIDEMLWLLAGSVLIGNRSINKIANARFGSGKAD